MGADAVQGAHTSGYRSSSLNRPLAANVRDYRVKYARETRGGNSHDLRSLPDALDEFRRDAQVPRQGHFTIHLLASSTCTERSSS